ncbi:MAG: acyl carrier protein [Desulfobacteraceae bacterium]|nr:acyl carrier protein [Desulfobacteraceae bacterium]
MQQSEILQQLEKAPLGRRQDMLTAYLQKQVAAVLDFDTSQLPDPGQGFFDIGMDSLTAVELRKQLEAGLGISLPSTLAFDYPSIKKGILHFSVDSLPECRNEILAEARRVQCQNFISALLRKCKLLLEQNEGCL